jgi:hypothetical protein
MDLTPYVVHALMLFLTIVSFFLIVLIIALGRLLAPRKAYGYILAALIPIAGLLLFRPLANAMPLTGNPWMDISNWFLYDLDSPLPDSVRSSVGQSIAALGVRDWTLNPETFLTMLRVPTVSPDLMLILPLFFIFVVFLIVGVKDSKTYESMFKGRKFVWFLFGLVVVGLVSSSLRTSAPLPFFALLLLSVLAVFLLAGVKDSKAYDRIFEGRKLAWFALGLAVVGLAWLVSTPVTAATVLFLVLVCAALIALILWGIPWVRRRRLVAKRDELTELTRRLAGVGEDEALKEEPELAKAAADDDKARKRKLESQIAFLRIQGQAKGYRYLVALLPPLLWLLAPLLLRDVPPPDSNTWRQVVKVLLFEFGAWYYWPLILIFGVYAAYIMSGETKDRFSFYRQAIAPRKSVWLTFGGVVLALAILVTGFVLDTSQRVSGMEATSANLADAIREVRSAADRLESRASSGLRATDSGQYQSFLQGLPPDVNNLRIQVEELQARQQAAASQLGQQTGAQPSSPNRQQQLVDVLAQVDTLALAIVANLDKMDAELSPPLSDGSVETLAALADEMDRSIAAADEGNSAWVGELQYLADGTHTLLGATTESGRPPDRRQVEALASRLSFLIARSNAEGGPNLDGMQPLVMQLTSDAQFSRQEARTGATDLLQRADEINDIAYDMQPTVSVLISDRTIPFLIVITLFVVFLLLPWLLYLSFILSKRATIIRDRRRVIEQLGLRDQFLDAPGALADRQQMVAKKVSKYLADASDVVRYSLRAEDANDPIQEAHKELTKVCGQYPDLDDLRDKLKSLSPDQGDASQAAARLQQLSDEALEVVIKQRHFYSREYILPLLILTALTMVGWFYVIFPNTLVGLVELVREGASLKQLTDDLTHNFTIVTMTFAGAWLYITTMLVTRWTQDDLHPRSYLYASLRLAIALLVGFVFGAWAQPASDGQGIPILVLAFAVGAAPLEWVRAVWRVLRRPGSGIVDRLSDWVLGDVAKEFQPPDWGSKYPLTVLEDVTIWDEGRLYLEGVQNVQALATADLARLAMNTAFDAQQLIDWVDQALLYMHVKELWRPGLAALGVRTITDLFDACRYSERDQDGRLACVVRAYNSAQLMSIGADDPRCTAYDAAGKLEKAGNELGAKATAVKEAAARLDKDRPATLDNVIALAEMVAGIDTLAAEEARVAACDALKKVNVDASAWEEGEALATRLKALTTGDDSHPGPLEQAKQALKNEALSREKLEADLGQAESADKPAQKALAEAQDKLRALLDRVANTKAAVEEAEKKAGQDCAAAELDDVPQEVKAAVTQVADLESAVKGASELANKLKKDAPTTWDNVKALHEDLKDLKQKAEKIETERVTLKEKLDALTEQQTLALREAIQKVDEVSTQDATTKAEEAVAACQDLSAGSDPAELAAAWKTAAEAATQSEKLKTAAGAAAEQAMGSSLPIRLTEDILQIMLDAMESDPNIKHVRSFWQQRKQAPAQTLLAGGQASFEDELRMRWQALGERMSTAEQARAEEEKERQRALAVEQQELAKRLQDLQMQVGEVNGHTQAQLDALGDRVTREQAEQRQAALTTLRADVDQALEQQAAAVKTHSQDLAQTAQSLQAALEAESAAQKRVTKLESALREKEEGLEEALGQIAALGDQVGEQEEALKEARQQTYDLRKLSLEAYDGSLQDIKGVHPGHLAKLKGGGITNTGKLLARATKSITWQHLPSYAFHERLPSYAFKNPNRVLGWLLARKHGPGDCALRHVYQAACRLAS